MGLGVLGIKIDRYHAEETSRWNLGSEGSCLGGLRSAAQHSRRWRIGLACRGAVIGLSEPIRNLAQRPHAYPSARLEENAPSSAAAGFISVMLAALSLDAGAKAQKNGLERQARPLLRPACRGAPLAAQGVLSLGTSLPPAPASSFGDGRQNARTDCRRRA